MSVTLRLEGLSDAAGSRDIRQYFSGLEIPLGGVTVIGGPQGEAFVNFITWEDARQAIQLSGRPLKDSIIYVSLSSREEMQRTLENVQLVSTDLISDRNGTNEKMDRDERNAQNAHSRRAYVYLRIKVSSFEATIADIEKYFKRLHIRDVLFLTDGSVRNGSAIVQFGNNADASEGLLRNQDGENISVTWSCEKEWIKLGGKIHYDDEHSRHGRRAHSRSSYRRSLSPRRRSPRRRSRSPRRRSRSPRRHSRSPRRRSKTPRRRSRSPRKRSKSPRKRSKSPRKRSKSPRKRSKSPRKRSKSPRKRSKSPRKRSRSPRKSSSSSGSSSSSSGSSSSSSGTGSSSSQRRSRSQQRRSGSWIQYSRSFKYFKSPRWPAGSPQKHSRSPHGQSDGHEPICPGEFHVHVTNLSYGIGKADIKKFFYNYVRDDHITFLYDEKGYRTRECFLLFTNEKHHKKVLQLDKAKFNGRPVYISSVSKSSMPKILAGRKAIFSYDQSKGKCIYLRNFSSDVTKSDVQEFFAGFSLNEGDIFLLCDKKGVCLGESLVRFSTEEEIAKAEKLNRKIFKGKQIPLKRIPEEKLKDFLRANSVNAMPADPYECVTQEDDTPEYKGVDQGGDTPDDGCVTQDASAPGNVIQTDNTHEFVTEADDASDDDCTSADITQEDFSFSQMDAAPNDQCVSKTNTTRDNECVTQADDTMDDGAM